MPKYDKYFITEPKPGDDIHLDTDLVKFPIYVDSEVIEGAHYFMAASHLGTTGRGAPEIEHTHDYDEYLVFLGTDHQEPRNLGGEIEFWIDGEKHTITKSCAVFIPAGVKHAPIYFKRIDTPIWYIATSPTKKYKLSPEMIEKMPTEMLEKLPADMLKDLPPDMKKKLPSHILKKIEQAPESDQ
jgi:mannose-6-phosphate isomerase-like protein (cupin superfamily)